MRITNVPGLECSLCGPTFTQDVATALFVHGAVLADILGDSATAQTLARRAVALLDQIQRGV